MNNIAHGYYALYENRVVHRDIKPQNILLKYDSNGSITTCKLTDFGVSRILADKAQAELSNVAGTFFYMVSEFERWQDVYTCWYPTIEESSTPTFSPMNFLYVEMSASEMSYHRLSTRDLRYIDYISESSLFQAPEVGANLLTTCAYGESRLFNTNSYPKFRLFCGHVVDRLRLLSESCWTGRFLWRFQILKRDFRCPSTNARYAVYFWIVPDEITTDMTGPCCPIAWSQSGADWSPRYSRSTAPNVPHPRSYTPRRRTLRARRSSGRSRSPQTTS